MLDNIKHHMSIWKAAWAEEKERRKIKRSYIDQDFLPAALEIMEKPASPIGRWLMIAIISFFAIAVTWSYFGKVEVVAVGMGRIIPSERVKPIQVADPGVVREIFVRDGDYVKAGTLLIELDPTFSGADEAEAEKALLAGEVRSARGRALLAYAMGEGAGVIDFPKATPDQARLIQNQIAAAAIAGYEANIKTLQEQRLEREEDLLTATLQKDSMEETLPLIKDQLESRESLLEKGYTPRFAYLELKERYLTQKNSITIQASQIKKMQAAIAGLDNQMEQLRQEFLQAIVSDLAEANQEVNLRQEELIKAKQRNSLQQIFSPVNGFVHQLAVNTKGAVVQAAQPIMTIVPEDEELVVEAMIPNKDIGFLQIGDDVTVKLEPFPFTKYGTIDGKLRSLSTDAIEDENLGLVYQARIELLEKTIFVAGREVKLTPGMIAIAEVKTGERRLIEFLLSPLLRYKDESLRER